MSASKHFIRYSWGLLMIMLFTIVSSCDPDFSTYCNNCTVTVPEEGKVLVEITFNSENTEVPVFIYKGKETGKDTVYADTLTQSPLRLFLKTEQDYSAEAIYQSGAQEIHAFDGGQIKVEETECDDEACYYAKVLNLDLTLIDP